MATSKTMIAGGAGAGITGLLALALSVATPEVQTFEGTVRTPYYDAVHVLTVCTGHTGPDIVVKKVYSSKECHDLTEADAKKAAVGVLKVSPQLIWHPMQLAAMISFVFNVGPLTYAKSSIAKLFNEGKFIEACNKLPLYKYAGGKIYPGLVTRRAREQEICLSTLTPEGMKNVVEGT